MQRENSRIEKGESGYIHNQKKKSVQMILIYACVSVLLFITGYFIYQSAKTNILAVLALLLMIPAARSLAILMTFIRFHSVKKEKTAKVNELCRNYDDVFSDVVIISKGKAIHFDFLCLKEGNLIGQIGNQNQNLEFVRNYMIDKVCQQFTSCQFKVTENFDEFLKEISVKSVSETSTAEEKRMKECLKALMA